MKKEIVYRDRHITILKAHVFELWVVTSCPISLYREEKLVGEREHLPDIGGIIERLRVSCQEDYPETEKTKAITWLKSRSEWDMDRDFNGQPNTQ